MTDQQIKLNDQFAALEHALTSLAACGVSVQFAEIYQCGQQTTAIIMPNVTITEQGRLVMQEER